MLDGKENTHGITTSEKKTYTVDEIAALLNISMKSVSYTHLTLPTIA